ncbi:E3 ubiquitin-protein ligase RNF169 [Paramormyrops kingsleyae]|uniref:E3 ubiquitin-protein ligase RNF169 n=1 Tax=Paramormyrops kingsleyae TaxID=1676925 RepID=UPI003B96C887
MNNDLNWVRQRRPERKKRPRGRGWAVGGAAASLLTQDDACCPVCRDVFVGPVTLPCRHSLCSACFRQKVERSSLRCPLCRLRLSGWARDSGQWDRVRRSYPERCRRRMEQREGEAPAEVIFRAPVHICKSGEKQQEYTKTKKRMELEQQKGEKVSEQRLQKIFEVDRRQVEIKAGLRPEDLASAEMSEEKQRPQGHLRQEDGGSLKHRHNSWCGVLSDSENEEPIGRRTRHVSAFVRKIRSPPASRILQNRPGQRSKSCTDSEDDRLKNRGPLPLTSAPKASVGYSHNAGILLSSENSRSLSAPILVTDKRNTCRGMAAVAGATFVAPPTKVERSISPESNDSISEELNHFKPIVCSPCTPPKRLPNGQVVEPTIVKSTPRNLTRSLQKHTSYEASPTILQKWKQIEKDRRGSKLTSKGTITSPLAEDFNLQESPAEKKRKIHRTSLEKSTLKECRTLPTSKSDTSGRKGERESYNRRRLIFDQSPGEPGLSLTQRDKVYTPRVANSVRGTCDTAQGKVSEPVRCDGPTSSLLIDGDSKPAVCNRRAPDTQDLSRVSHARNDVKSRPTSWRGRKRSQKTKHLEDAGVAKNPKMHGDNGHSAPEFDGGCWLSHRLQQEKEDLELALKLQRQFNREFEKVDRQKTSHERYLLRSWASVDSTRRSRRISERNKHFNYSW